MTVPSRVARGELSLARKTQEGEGSEALKMASRKEDAEKGP